LSYCQNVQPRFDQLFAGIVGPATSQWATQKTPYPWSAKAVVSPRYFFQKVGLE